MPAPSTARARSHIFHLLWTGDFSCDMHQRLSERTPLTPRQPRRKEYPMPSRKPAVLQLGDEIWEVDTANTTEVRLIHRVTGDVARCRITSSLTSSFVTNHRAPLQLDTLPKHVIAAANALAIDIEEVVSGVGAKRQAPSSIRPGDHFTGDPNQPQARRLENAGRTLVAPSFS